LENIHLQIKRFPDNWKTFIFKYKDLENWARNINVQDIISKKYSQIIWHLKLSLFPHHGGVYKIHVKCRPFTKVREDGEAMILTSNHVVIGNVGRAVSTS
jgi:hypothetical protein